MKYCRANLCVLKGVCLLSVLREKRKASQYTQKALSKAACLTQSAISNIETGQRKPSVESAKKLGAVLGFDWSELFEEDEKAPPDDGTEGVNQ